MHGFGSLKEVKSFEGEESFKVISDLIAFTVASAGATAVDLAVGFVSGGVGWWVHVRSVQLKRPSSWV